MSLIFCAKHSRSICYDIVSKSRVRSLADFDCSLVDKTEMTKSELKVNACSFDCSVVIWMALNC
jgi:hypothetical protein